MNLSCIEEEVLNSLKDFQRATVEHVFSLFINGQNRVLVADEVGLGKTLIAKGTIAKLARHYKEKYKKDIFKVVYVCSNLNIANQNIRKLKVTDNDYIDNISDTRISMQHLKVFEQEIELKNNGNYIQLIPITPSTSFNLINGGYGNADERALIFVILKGMGIFNDYLKELNIILTDTATSSFNNKLLKYEERVKRCNEKTNGKYLKTIIEKIKSYSNFKEIYDETVKVCLDLRNNKIGKKTVIYRLISKLRIMFASISLDFLNPDLIIMDEFQRFKFLISEDSSTEIGLLVSKFLKGKEEKVLLLSATPYKLFSTMEEISEIKLDEHYVEFFEVINFLFNDEIKLKEFKEIWKDYSIKLRELNFDFISVIEAKNNAEDALYRAVCRTERISAIEEGDFVDDREAKETLKISEKDILSYIEAESLIKEIGLKFSVPVDYVKSSPYIMSFMREYKLKEYIEKYFKDNPQDIHLAEKKLLWIDEDAVRRYEKIDITNSRLQKLLDEAFKNNSQLLLWVPPSKPYYEFKGFFKGNENFSKILVFSSWEMVPRMIASLVSYECERRTIGKLLEVSSNKQNADYFAPNNKRFPYPRLRFSLLLESPQAMSLFCLLYPSKTLANLYDPIKYLNEKKTLSEIEKDLKEKINKLLSKLKIYQETTSREDDRWYYLTPLLLDDGVYVENWFDALNGVIKELVDDEKGAKGFKAHIQKLKEYYDLKSKLKLGKMPKDLDDVLVNMAISSPAVCSYRTYEGNSLYATKFAKAVMDMFNKPEAIAAVDLSFNDDGLKKEKQKNIFARLLERIGVESEDRAYWKNVLLYCKHGNFQALLDEYKHMIIDLYSIKDSKDKIKIIGDTMIETVKTHTASYKVDTLKSFKGRIKGEKTEDIQMRSHYAVSYHKSDETTSDTNRKESIRKAFNSPFRPFVLATTSIGQEGLDFHLYCRKIMHWNLPLNPIDLEQREGRINRYKCLAIRQNLVKRYGDRITFKNDVWDEIFDYATKELKKDESDLVPYWCIPDNQEIKIERFVPAYPLSKDVERYERIIKILSLYRLTLGQTRQEELLEHIFEKYCDVKELKKLFINLSPYYKNIKK